MAASNHNFDDYNVNQQYDIILRNSSIHSVIYHDSHVSLPNDGATGCGADTSVREWLEKVQNSAIPEYDGVPKKGTASTADKLKKPLMSNNFHAAPLVQR